MLRRITIMRNMTITTDSPILHAVLAGDCPSGVRLVSPPPVFTRSFDVSVHLNFDIKITVDLGLISVTAFAAWLVRRASALKGVHRIEHDGKHVSIDDADAPEVIANKIQNEHDRQKPKE